MYGTRLLSLPAIIYPYKLQINSTTNFHAKIKYYAHLTFVFRNTFSIRPRQQKNKGNKKSDVLHAYPPTSKPQISIPYAPATFYRRTTRLAFI